MPGRIATSLGVKSSRRDGSAGRAFSVVIRLRPSRRVGEVIRIGSDSARA
jgi:hypothetical protein